MLDPFVRLNATMMGGIADHVPVSIWYHFGSEHLPPKEVADQHLAFQKAYEWDYLKINFDYRAVTDTWSLPDNIQVCLSQLSSAHIWNLPFKLQESVISGVARGTKEATPLLATIYSPFFYLLRHLGRSSLLSLLSQPEHLREILYLIAERTIIHLNHLQNLGIWGIYYAIWLPSHQMPMLGSSDEKKRNLVYAHDEVYLSIFSIERELSIKILSKAASLKRFLHLHGGQLISREIADWPCDVLHGETQSANSDGLVELRSLDPEKSKMLMGGLPHQNLSQLTSKQIRAQIDDVFCKTGPTGLFFAPSCSVTPSIAKSTLIGIRDYTRSASANMVSQNFLW